MTVCVKYGFGEGDWLGNKMIPALQAAGFAVTQDEHEADIILSHSGGCYYLAKTRPDQRIVLIDPPYWPGKSIFRSMPEKIWNDFNDFRRKGKFGRWCVKTTWNTLYMARHPVVNLNITRLSRRNTFYQALAHDRVVIIRNTSDAFCTPHIQELLISKTNFEYRTLPGQHDDCWENPEPYIKVLQSIT